MLIHTGNIQKIGKFITEITISNNLYTPIVVKKCYVLKLTKLSIPFVATFSNAYIYRVTFRKSASLV
jgi:hypothetical protein